MCQAHEISTHYECAQTFLDVVHVDDDEGVAVPPGVFVPHPQHMQHLVHHRAVDQAAGAEVDTLSPAHSTYIGVTPGQRRYVRQYFCYFCFAKKIKSVSARQT